MCFVFISAAATPEVPMSSLFKCACEPGSLHVYSGKCLWVSNWNYDWYQARDFCFTAGGRLLIADTEEMFVFLQSGTIQNIGT